MKKIGVAVIGLGVGEQHAYAYAKHSGCEIRWLYDVDNPKAQEVARRLGQGTVAERFEQCIEDRHVQIVSVASYDEAHFEQIMAGLNAGKHLFVEKPLCQTAEQLRSIHTEWKKHKGSLKLFSNLILRAAPVYQWLKDECRKGSFGKLYALDADYLYGRFYKLMDDWRGQDPHYSVMEGGGVHMIDLMLWLTEDRPVTVECFGNRICTEHWQNQENQSIPFLGNDYATAVMLFDSGLIAKITANAGCVHPHQHVMRVFGTDATFLYDDMGARVHRGRDNAPSVELLKMPTLPSHKGDLIPSFVEAVQKDEDWSKQTQTIFDGISICLAADHSAKVHTPVEVQYL